MSFWNDLSNAAKKVVRVVKQVAEQAAAAQSGGGGGGGAQSSSSRASSSRRSANAYATPTSKGLPIASMRPRPLPRTARGLAVSRFWTSPSSKGLPIAGMRPREASPAPVKYLGTSAPVTANVAAKRGGGMPLAFVDIGLPSVGDLAGGALSSMSALMRGDANVDKISRPGPSGYPYRATDWVVRGTSKAASRLFGWQGVVDQAAKRIGRTGVATKLNELSRTPVGRFGVRAFKKIGIAGEVVGISDYLKVRQRAYSGEANERRSSRRR